MFGLDYDSQLGPKYHQIRLGYPVPLHSSFPLFLLVRLQGPLSWDTTPHAGPFSTGFGNGGRNSSGTPGLTSIPGTSWFPDPKEG